MISVQGCVAVSLASPCISTRSSSAASRGRLPGWRNDPTAGPHTAQLSIRTGRRRQVPWHSHIWIGPRWRTTAPPSRRPGWLDRLRGHMHRGCPPDPGARCGDCECDDNRGEGPAPLGMLMIHAGPSGWAITCGRHRRRLYYFAAVRTQQTRVRSGHAMPILSHIEVRARGHISSWARRHSGVFDDIAGRCRPR